MGDARAGLFAMPVLMVGGMLVFTSRNGPCYLDGFLLNLGADQQGPVVLCKFLPHQENRGLCRGFGGLL